MPEQRLAKQSLGIISRVYYSSSQLTGDLIAA